MTPLQIAVASADAFVILTGSSITGNLLAGWLSRWWALKRGERFMRELRAKMPADFPRPDWEGALRAYGIVRAPMPGGRCEHLRERELCDDCNNNQWAKDFLGDKKGD